MYSLNPQEACYIVIHIVMETGDDLSCDVTRHQLKTPTYGFADQSSSQSLTRHISDRLTSCCFVLANNVPTDKRRYYDSWGFFLRERR